MYKLLNKIFGWDYVLVGKIGYYSETFYYRVKVDGEGNAFITDCYRNFILLKGRENVLWLTCKREKYVTTNENKGV